MNKSSREYQRGLTTNSFNQDFIYYKYSKELEKSPKMKKHALSYQEHQQQTNHAKIQSMKNTLNLLGQNPSKAFTKSFNKSVMELPTDNKRKSQVLKYASSLHEESIDNTNYNNKLYSLTEKLREIAQKKHFSIVQGPSKKDKYKKAVCKTSEDAYVNNMQLIMKKNLKNEQTKLQEFISKETNLIIQKEKDSKKLNNYSQQLVRSQSKSSGSFYKNEMGSDASQSSSLKRQPKNSKNEKSMNSFNFSQDIHNDFQYLQRPRGKTIANLLHEPIVNDMESTKIKINSFLLKKQPSNKRSNQNSDALGPQKMYNALTPQVLNVLKPHRGPITSIIINSDGKRFLTASNDYTIKESTLEETYTTIRKHKGRINVMKMIDDKLYSGGNDCRLMIDKGSFTFQSPVVEIYSGQSGIVNVGTSSCVHHFNMAKRVSIKKIDATTKFYRIFQKPSKDIYVVDNHNLSVVDWRVPNPLINLYETSNYIDDWISNPYTLAFHQIRDCRLIQIGILNNGMATEKQEHVFEQDIRDCSWKRDKAYFLTNQEVQIFEHSRNDIRKVAYFPLDSSQSKPNKLQVKFDLFVYGTLDGKLVVNKFG